MTLPFPEPTDAVSSPAEVFLRYLDYFRARLLTKIEALPPADRRRSRLPSGWTPAELLRHVTYDEVRWLEWRFEGRDVPRPRATIRTAAGTSRRRRACATWRRRCTRRPPGPGPSSRRTTWLTWASRGDRWPGASAGPATLERVLRHLLQELAGGDVGE